MNKGKLIQLKNTIKRYSKLEMISKTRMKAVWEMKKTEKSTKKQKTLQTQ